MPEYIGRYRTERVLGSGAFALVWLAVDEALDAHVAIKVLAENWAQDEGVRQRFSDEGRILWRGGVGASGRDSVTGRASCGGRIRITSSACTRSRRLPTDGRTSSWITPTGARSTRACASAPPAATRSTSPRPCRSAWTSPTGSRSRTPSASCTGT